MLPEVPSTTVPPGLSFPVVSASLIMLAAIRSLLVPPGLRNSTYCRKFWWHGTNIILSQGKKLEEESFGPSTQFWGLHAGCLIRPVAIGAVDDDGVQNKKTENQNPTGRSEFSISLWGRATFLLFSCISRASRSMSARGIRGQGRSRRVHVGEACVQEQRTKHSWKPGQLQKTTHWSYVENNFPHGRVPPRESWPSYRRYQRFLLAGSLARGANQLCDLLGPRPTINTPSPESRSLWQQKGSAASP